MDNRKIIRAAGSVGLLVSLSRVFGMLRDMVMAATFGTSLAMSAFVVAFTIPNLFRGLFGEGAMSSAFVPIFTQAREEQGESRSWVLAQRMFSVLAATLAGVVLIGILIATLLLRLYPDSERFALIFRLLRVMFPYTFFICLAAFFSAMLNSIHIFALPAAAPVVLNIVMIAAVLAVRPFAADGNHAMIMALAWAVILAGLLQAGMLVPTLLKRGFRLRLERGWLDEDVRQVWRLMGVAFVGVGATQLNVLIDRFIATFINKGSPSYLYFAERLIYLPLGIFATALGTVLLPAFSDLAAERRSDKMLDVFSRSSRQLFFIMMPAAAGIMALASPIVRIIYERGDFSAESTRMTTLALLCYAPGLVMFSLLKILVPMFYAVQDMKTPVRVGLACTALNIALSLALMWPFKHMGIALATVIAASAHAAALAWLLQSRIGRPDWQAILSSFSRVTCATLLMVGCALYCYPWLNRLCESLDCRFGAAVALAGSLLCSAAVYLLSAALFRCRELDELIGALRRARKI